MVYSLAVWFLVAVVVVVFSLFLAVVLILAVSKGIHISTISQNDELRSYSLLRRMSAFARVLFVYASFGCTQLFLFCFFPRSLHSSSVIFVIVEAHNAWRAFLRWLLQWNVSTNVYIRVCLPPMSGEKHFTISQSVYKITRAQREREMTRKKIILFAYVVSPYRIRCINGKPHTRFPAGWRSLLSTIVNIL